MQSIRSNTVQKLAPEYSSKYLSRNNININLQPQTQRVINQYNSHNSQSSMGLKNHSGNYLLTSASVLDKDE